MNFNYLSENNTLDSKIKDNIKIENSVLEITERKKETRGYARKYSLVYFHYGVIKFCKLFCLRHNVSSSATCGVILYARTVI